MSSLFHALQISRYSMMSRVYDMDSLSNNLANLSTTGYKKARTNFSEILENADKQGARIHSTQTIFHQGLMQETGNPLDMGIEGDGYFQIKLADGRTAYTRDGTFTLDSARNIVNTDGNMLVWDGTVPEGVEEIRVDGGKIWTRIGAEWTQSGTFQTARFTNENGLLDNGNNSFLATAISGDPKLGDPGSAGFGRVRSQYIEMSNVNSGDEMVRMMRVQREFSIATKTFQQTDQMIAGAITMRRG